MPVGGPSRLLRFGAFVLDLSRCTLRRGSEELPLRPKSFDVLVYLAEHPGRVVSKAELFDAVWPEVSVTDDSLVQCIGEVRQALGDSGRRLLRTMAKRGYVLDTQVIEDNSHCNADAGPSSAGEIAEDAHPFWLVSNIRRWRRAMPAAAAIIIFSATSLIVFVERQAPTPNSNALHLAAAATALLDKQSSLPANREALALFSKALEIDPNNVPALVGYGRVLVTDVAEGWVSFQERHAQLAQAEAGLRQALQINPHDPSAHHITGLLWRVRGDPDRAILALQQALRLAPTKAWARAALGRAKIEAGDARQALDDLATAMRLAPDEPAIFIWYFQAGMAAVHAADGEAALGWFRKSEEKSSAYRRNIVLWRAVALADIGRDDEARTLIATHLAEAPEESIAKWTRYFPSPNAIVAAQRTRIAEVLTQLGVPTH